MKKFSDFKTWLLIEDVAKRLSLSFGEEVSIADVLQLGIERKLTLSIVFAGGINVSELPEVEVGNDSFDEDGALNFAGGYVVPWRNKFFLLPRKVSNLKYAHSDKVFDLTMLGGDALYVDERYWEAINQPYQRSICETGIQLALDDKVYALLGDKPTEPCFMFPDRARLVVRTSAIEDFEKRAVGGEQDSNRPLDTRERNTLITIIGALCSIARIDYLKPAKAAGQIKHELDLKGHSVGETTIEGHLKKIPDALASRAK